MNDTERLEKVLRLLGMRPLEPWNEVQAQAWREGKLVGPCGTNSHIQYNDFAIEARVFFGTTAPTDGEHGNPVFDGGAESHDVGDLTHMACWCPKCRGLAFVPPPEVFEAILWDWEVEGHNLQKDSE
jgi:hypothetical protein